MQAYHTRHGRVSVCFLKGLARQNVSGESTNQFLFSLAVQQILEVRHFKLATKYYFHYRLIVSRSEK